MELKETRGNKKNHPESPSDSDSVALIVFPGFPFRGGHVKCSASLMG